MTPTEMEELLRRIPDLAPSPDLEARIVAAAKHRTVVRRRFPALLPAAAAFLFCVGVIVSLLSTLSSPGGKGKSEEAFVIRFPVENFPDLERQLPQMKDRKIVFAGPPGTPWGPVLRIHRACVKAEIAACEWRIADQSLKVVAYVPLRTGEPDRIILEAMLVRLSRDPARGGISRRVGDRGPVELDQELLQILLSMKADYMRAGKRTFPVLIDAAVDVPWQEVARVIEMCRKEGFSDFLLDPPIPHSKIDPPLWKPERRFFPDRPEDK